MFYVYLDTSFLSELTKAQSEISRTPNDNKWIKLLSMLRQGVKRGTFLCPASQFQIQEAMLAKGLLEEFVSLQLELSKGFFFKEWQDILVHQFANQVLMYLKRPQDIDLGWKFLTKKCPNVIDEFMTIMMKLNMTKYAEHARQLRKKFGREASYEDYYREEKADFLGGTFLNPNSNLSEMLIREAKVGEEEVPVLFSFLNPQSVDCVSFINIFCSLWASTIFHEQTRKYKCGDLLDIVALACVIPYCRIVTTDTNMKNMIERLRLDEKHGVSVYSPVGKDLASLEKELSRLGNR